MSDDTRQNLGGTRVWVSDNPTLGHLEIIQHGATGNEKSALDVIAEMRTTIARLTRERDEAVARADRYEKAMRTAAEHASTGIKRILISALTPPGANP